MQTLIIIATIIILFSLLSWMNNRGIRRIRTAEAENLLKDADLTILDVRSPEEFRQGHIKGARLLPLPELREKIGELTPLKDKAVLVYCHAGSRSTMASQLLKKNGFTKINNLVGGITAWSSAGKKTVR